MVWCNSKACFQIDVFNSNGTERFKYLPRKCHSWGIYLFRTFTLNSLINLKIDVSPKEANYLSDVDGEIIIPDDGILNTTYFMLMYGSGMYLGKRSIDCSPNLDHRLLGNCLIRASNGT